MGCDIHAYIEFEKFITREGTPWIICFAEDVYIGRNYELFALMAGVRYDPNRADYKPLFFPRGIPKPLSFTVEDKYTLYVSDKDYERQCKLVDAERWVSNHSSEWWDEDHSRVTHPDWHSASWLTAQELEQVQETYAATKMADTSWYQFNDKNIPDGATVIPTDRGFYVEVGERKTLGKDINLEAVITAMKVLDGDKPGRSRLVFWFDN